MDLVENVGDRDSARTFKEAPNEGIERMLEALILFLGEGVDVSVEAKVSIGDVKSGFVS